VTWAKVVAVAALAWTIIEIEKSIRRRVARPAQERRDRHNLEEKGGGPRQRQSSSTQTPGPVAPDVRSTRHERTSASGARSA
jgi:hypothetical protein